MEALATGIPIVRRALAGAGLPPAHFIDSDIHFTVVVPPTPSGAQHGPAQQTELRVDDALATGPAPSHSSRPN